MSNQGKDRGLLRLAHIAPGLLEQLQAAAERPSVPKEPDPDSSPTPSEQPLVQDDATAAQYRLSKKRRQVIGRKFKGAWFRSHNALVDRWLRVIGIDAFVVYQVLSREARGQTPDLVTHLSAKRISFLAGICRVRVFVALKSLEEYQLIERQYSPGRENIYLLIDPSLWGQGQTVATGSETK